MSFEKQGTTVLGVQWQRNDIVRTCRSDVAASSVHFNTTSLAKLYWHRVFFVFSGFVIDTPVIKYINCTIDLAGPALWDHELGRNNEQGKRRIQRLEKIKCNIV